MRNPFPVEVSKVFQNTQKTTRMRKCVICFVISYNIGATAKCSSSYKLSNLVKLDYMNKHNAKSLPQSLIRKYFYVEY